MHMHAKCKLRVQEWRGAPDSGAGFRPRGMHAHGEGASSASEPHRASGRADDSDKADASDRTDNSDIANDSDTADDTDMTRILPRPLPRRVRYRRTGR